MKYILNLFFLVEYKWHLQTLVPLLLITSIFIVILLVLTLWPMNISIKITKKGINYFAVFLYIGVYVILLIGFRIFYLNNDLNIYKYIDFLLVLYDSKVQITVLFIFIMLFLISAWLLMFIKGKNLLSLKTWQLHFYWHYAPYIVTCYRDRMPMFNANADFYKYKTFYNKYLLTTLKFEEYLDFYSLGHRICWALNKFLKLFNIKADIQMSAKYIEFIYFSILFILIITAIYECIWYHFVLHYTVYILYFFLLFNIWSSLSKCCNIDLSLSRILFEQAYCFPEIVFINLTDEEELELYNFLHYPDNIHLQTSLFDYLNDCRLPLMLNPIYFYKRFYKFKLYDVPIFINFDIDPNGIWFRNDDLEIINGKFFVSKLYKYIPSKNIEEDEEDNSSPVTAEEWKLFWEKIEENYKNKYEKKTD